MGETHPFAAAAAVRTSWRILEESCLESLMFSQTSDAPLGRGPRVCAAVKVTAKSPSPPRPLSPARTPSYRPLRRKGEVLLGSSWKAFRFVRLSALGKGGAELFKCRFSGSHPICQPAILYTEHLLALSRDSVLSPHLLCVRGGVCVMVHKQERGYSEERRTFSFYRSFTAPGSASSLERRVRSCQQQSQPCYL